MTHYFTVPGLGSSGPAHWQTYFENVLENIQRVEQQEWDAPICNQWIETLDKAIANVDPATVVLIGHSLGCLTIAHWAKQFGRTIKGALLVAPSDPEAKLYTFPVQGFAPVPLEPIPFKTIVVASADDPWVSLERATDFATHWGSDFHSIGNAGHINVASGHGPWEDGLAILKRLE